MSDEKQLFYRRAFLNDKEGAAMIEATLTDNGYEDRDGKHHSSIDGDAHITDCSRSIQLDFGADSLEAARAMARKIDRLIDTFQGMRDALSRVAKREFGKRV
jgi:hypothetical protein